MLYVVNCYIQQGSKGNNMIQTTFKKRLLSGKQMSGIN
jgi:hypothetical protein